MVCSITGGWSLSGPLAAGDVEAADKIVVEIVERLSHGPIADSGVSGAAAGARMTEKDVEGVGADWTEAGARAFVAFCFSGRQGA